MSTTAITPPPPKPVPPDQATMRYRSTHDWLEATANLSPPLVSATAWALATVNGWLVGAARLAIEPGGGCPVLRIDIPSEPSPGEATPLPDVAAIGDQARAATTLARQALARDLRLVPAGAAPDPAVGRQFAEWCAESGHRCSVSDDGAVAISVGSHPARLEPVAGSHPEVVVPLGDLSGHSSTAREAVGHLLLGLGASFRGVRGAVVRREDRTVATVSAAIAALDSAAAVDRAVEALAVACRATAEEVLALEDETLACEYLSRRGWEFLAPPRASSQATGKEKS